MRPPDPDPQIGDLVNVVGWPGTFRLVALPVTHEGEMATLTDGKHSFSVLREDITNDSSESMNILEMHGGGEGPGSSLEYRLNGVPLEDVTNDSVNPHTKEK